MDERRKILEQIELGEISVEEGARRLEGLSSGPAEPEPSASEGTASAGTASEAATPVIEPVESAPDFTPPAWANAARYAVLWLGVVLTAWGGSLLASAYTSEVPSGRLGWGWVLFFLGVGGIATGWWLQKASWLYVRVREPGSRPINIALPVPFGLVAGLLRFLGPFIPQLQDTGADEVILAMRDELRAGNPMVVQVDEGEDGEQVEVYFI
jgi:hypothetical protein